MSKYTREDILDAQYASQFYNSLKNEIKKLQEENSYLRQLLLEKEGQKKVFVYHDVDKNAFEVKTEDYMPASAIVFYSEFTLTAQEAEQLADDICVQINSVLKQRNEK